MRICDSAGVLVITEEAESTEDRYRVAGGSAGRHGRIRSREGPDAGGCQEQSYSRGAGSIQPKGKIVVTGAAGRGEPAVCRPGAEAPHRKECEAQPNEDQPGLRREETCHPRSPGGLVARHDALGRVAVEIEAHGNPGFLAGGTRGGKHRTRRRQIDA